MEKVYIKEKGVERKLLYYLKPEYVYMKIGNNLLFKENDYIRKGSMISEGVYSSVSGIVRGIINNDNGKYMIIENDYKEKENRSKYKEKKLLDKSDYVIINAIDEIYTYVKRSIINYYIEDILKRVDDITTNINKVFICISRSDNYSYEKINKYIGSYPKMKIIMIDDFYLNNNDNILRREVFGYCKGNVSVIDVFDLYDKYNTIITLGGCIKKTNIVVKNGTLLSDIMKFLGVMTNNKCITVNGVLGGITLDTNDIVIDNSVKSVFITDKKEESERTCVNCGRCLRVCPVNLIPIYIKNNMNDKEKLNSLNVNRCLECGICSYVCPSNIDLKKYVKEAKEIVKNE